MKCTSGGAQAHGHPLGATGAILMTKLIHELERTNGILLPHAPLALLFYLDQQIFMSLRL